MNFILGIDPGTTETAYCLIDKNYKILMADKINNEEFINLCFTSPNIQIACESLQSYGMPVGREVFETAYIIGRIIQKANDNNIPYTLYPRPEYAKSICGVKKVTDAVLKQALEMRFGGYKKGETLAMLKGNSDKRSAFAVAVYHLDKEK